MVHVEGCRLAPSLSPLRIGVVIKGLGLGGAERLLADALPYLDRSRFAYHFAYMAPWKDALVPRFVEAGLPITCLGGEPRTPGDAGAREVTAPGSWRAAGLMPLAAVRLAALQRRESFDLIHADLPAAGIVARIVGRLSGIPVVYTEHNVQERYHPLTRAMNRATYGWNAAVLAVSDEVAASIRRNGMDRGVAVRTLLNGIPVEAVRAEATGLDDLRQELDLPEGRPVVGTVAVFRRQKRLLDWLAAAQRVAAAREDALFLLAGDGPEMPAVREAVAQLGLQERVRLAGFREDGRRLMGLMDVYLMTSEFEGLPLAMLEAMALGKPVAATAVGGIPEVIEPGREGLLAGVGEVERLAAHVLALLENPAAAAEMGERGAGKVAAQYHTRRRVQAIEEVYLEVLRGAA